MKSLHQVRVEEMMSKAGQKLPIAVTVPEIDTRILRAKLIMEEAFEAVDALGLTTKINSEGYGPSCIDSDDLLYVPHDYHYTIDPAHLAKELADISVVTTGTASAFGIHLEPVLEAVDENNLAKFGPGGYRNEYGKWCKPPNHPKPDIDSVLQKQS